jgi:hypothetical protein
MKNKIKHTKGTNSTNAQPKPTPSNHENFRLGQGYGSGEGVSEYQEHPSKKQLGDNPLPKSGGGYAKAGNAQPHSDSSDTAN